MTDFEPHIVYVSDEDIRIEVKDIDLTKAQLVAHIDIVDRLSASFVYGTRSDLSGTTTTIPYIKEFIPSVFNQGIEDLTPGITYYYRLILLTNRGYMASKTLSFTPGGRPVVKTIAASNISSNSATLNGIVMGGGYSTNVTFIYGTSETLSSGVMTKTSSIPGTISGANNIPVSLPILNLEAGVKYYYRIHASNIKGMSIGEIRSFTAQGHPLVEDIKLEELEELKDSKAIISAKVKPSGTAASVELIYGFTPDLSGKTTIIPYDNTVISDTLVKFEITDIQDMIYYCQIKSTNEVGVTHSNIINFIKSENDTCVSNVINFATLEISVLAPSNKTNDTITLNSRIYTGGYSSSIEIIYGLDSDLKGKVNKIQLPCHISDVLDRTLSQDLTDLDEDTMYYYQFIMKNSSGTFYSIIDSFDTTPEEPILQVEKKPVKVFSNINMSGPYGGKTVVTLNGENFKQVKSVIFPTYPRGTSADFEVISDNVLLAVAPAITSTVKLGPLNRGAITLIDADDQTFKTETEYIYCAPTNNACFPSSATVLTCDEKEIKMSELNIGDKIQASLDLEYSEVYLFTHALPTAEATFLNFTLESGLTLSLTPCHCLYVNNVLLPAEAVKIGDTLESVKNKRDKVVEVKWITETGLFNPHTISGDVIVNGVRTSTYTKAIPAKLAHAMLEPVRYLYSLGSL
jgi:hypothetical protein